MRRTAPNFRAVRRTYGTRTRTRTRSVRDYYVYRVHVTLDVPCTYKTLSMSELAQGSNAVQEDRGNFMRCTHGNHTGVAKQESRKCIGWGKKEKEHCNSVPSRVGLMR